MLNTKEQTFVRFKEWKVKIETQTERKIKYLRTDNGLEFLSTQFNNFCSENGITRHKPVTYTPQME